MSRVLWATVEGIRHLIQDQFEPDERLPTEQELVEQFAVSRATVREATTRLEMAGLVEKRWGVGTFVARPKPPTAFGLLSIADGIPGVLGTTGGEASMHRFEVIPHAPDSESFPDFETAETALVRRVFSLDGTPAVAIEDRVIANYAGERPDFAPLAAPAGLMRTVLRAVGVELTALDNDLFAADLDERGQELLGVSEPEPVIELVGTGWDAEGRPIVKTHAIYRTQLLRLRVTAS